MQYIISLLLILFVNISFAQELNNKFKHIRFERGTFEQITPVQFKVGTAELLPEGDSTLLEIKDLLQSLSYITAFRIEGHYFDGKKPEKNLNLSKERALVVSKRLVQLGVDCSRLVPVGFGDTKPQYPTDSPEKALNNRMVFITAAVKGKLIGGMPADGGGQSAGDPCR